MKDAEFPNASFPSRNQFSNHQLVSLVTKALITSVFPPAFYITK